MNAQSEIVALSKDSLSFGRMKTMAIFIGWRSCFQRTKFYTKLVLSEYQINYFESWADHSEGSPSAGQDHPHRRSTAPRLRGFASDP